MDNLVERLRTRAHIRRTIRAKESQFKAENDRIADLCDEAADALESVDHAFKVIEKHREMQQSDEG